MDTLKYKDYEGTAEIDMSRRVCHGRILFIDDLVTYQAADPAALQDEFEAAVDDYLQTCTDVGKEPQRPFKGLFNVRVPPAIHRAAAMRAVSDEVALNDVVVRALDAFLNVRSAVNHTVTVTFETPPRMIKTVQAVASDNVQWGTSNVH
ncbi:MAG: type II toxin-antitoxin system HicB family antitoxin [Rubrivivax sp.]|nr:type II toxin-antitoxin system HicB family antitoxin [Rubrivivax sp.]